MRLSHYFLPVLKENPTDAQVISHRLMLRSGMIMQTTTGIYSWLPLGNLVLKNVENIIRDELNKAGNLEVIMPTIQPADLWNETSRYDAYGKEMLRIQDRHERDLLYSPTAEEVIHDIVRKHMRSYRELPATFYQINWKFRDEIRPRFGVMRGREFLMKDAYSFDLNEHNARQTYRRMMETYVRIFARMGLVALPVRAPTGPIGGDLSHEFHVLAMTGESLIYYDMAVEDIIQQSTASFDLDYLMNLYCMEDEMHNPTSCPVPSDRLRQARGIEVGHVFYYGTKYTDPMKITVKDSTGASVPLYGGCYGIGVSRLVGAIIEACHDEYGIVWPTAIAPYKVGLINVRQGHDKSDQVCDELYATLREKGISVLYDDRIDSAGVKFSSMDLIGLPWQIRVGPRSLEKNHVEIKCRKTGDTQELSISSALTQLLHQLSSP